MKINILYFLFILCIILILYKLFNIYLKNKIIDKENFACTVPNINRQGGINNKNVLLTYKAQSNILNESCDEYWYKPPLEYNNTQIQDSPIPIHQDQLNLPDDKKFADNTYKTGLIDYKKLAQLSSNNQKNYKKLMNTSKELLIDPLSKKNIKYLYELEFAFLMLNRKTFVDRWEFYNPTIKQKFNYDDIKSPIEDINLLNKELKNRFDMKQKFILDNSKLLIYGLIPFEIFKYKILKIVYQDSNENKPIYIIQIAFFRESDLYLTTFSYVGYINESRKPMLYDIKYIGYEATDKVLLAKPSNTEVINQQIINTNFDNSQVIEKDPSAVVNIAKKQREAYKLNNQYACFNLAPSDTKKNYLLPYFSRELCESSYDLFGRPKDIGVYDTPCKKNEDCPFYKINKNYDNEFGKCLPDGHCELPLNMIPIGYKYFRTERQFKPMCYNCEKKKFNQFGALDICCDEQYDKKQYPFLKSPDYSFEGDLLPRDNYFNQKNCYSKPGEYGFICK